MSLDAANGALPRAASCDSLGGVAFQATWSEDFFCAPSMELLAQTPNIRTRS
jgi:hypothetical protein